MNKKVIIGSLVAVVAILGTATIAWASTGNYQNWRSVMGNRATNVTEANFGQFQQMQQLMASGDYAGAQKIRTELGLGQGRSGGGAGCGMHQGAGNGTGTGCQGGDRKNFVDENKDGICDHAAAVAK